MIGKYLDIGNSDRCGTNSFIDNIAEVRHGGNPNIPLRKICLSIGDEWKRDILCKKEHS
jgi:hypothetical protein